MFIFGNKAQLKKTQQKTLEALSEVGTKVVTVRII